MAREALTALLEALATEAAAHAVAPGEPLESLARAGDALGEALAGGDLIGAGGDGAESASECCSEHVRLLTL